MQHRVEGITQKDGASIATRPIKVGTSAGVASALVPCAIKAGGHSFAFRAQFFAIADASPFERMRVKSLGRTGRGSSVTRDLGGAAADNFSNPVHKDAL